MNSSSTCDEEKLPFSTAHSQRRLIFFISRALTHVGNPPPREARGGLTSLDIHSNCIPRRAAAAPSGQRSSAAAKLNGRGRATIETSQRNE